MKLCLCDRDEGEYLLKAKTVLLGSQLQWAPFLKHLPPHDGSLLCYNYDHSSGAEARLSQCKRHDSSAIQSVNDKKHF